MDKAATNYPARPWPIFIATLLCVAWAIASLVDDALFYWSEGFGDTEPIMLLTLFFPMVFAGLIWQGIAVFRILMVFWMSFWVVLPIMAICAATGELPWMETGKFLLFGLWPMMFFGVPAVMFAFLPVSNRFFKLCKDARRDGVVIA